MADRGKSMWLRFFRDAGIQSGFDTKYALLFDENRIKMDMLMDINKECLRDMGITAMGDMIAILKHSKQVYEETKTQAYDVPNPTSSTVIRSSSADKGSSPSSASSSSSSTSGPRSVIINNKSLEKSTKPVTTSKVASIKSFSGTGSRMRSLATGLDSDLVIKTRPVVPGPKAAARFSLVDCDSTESSRSAKAIINLRTVSNTQREEVPFQKKTRVLPEQEGGYKIIMPEGKTLKTQKLLQDRLGPGPSTGLPPEKKSSVFARLGGDGNGRVSSSSEIKRSTDELIDTRKEESEKSSVFARLGKSGSGNGSITLKSSEELLDSPEFLRTKFTIRQPIESRTPRSPSADSRERTIPVASRGSLSCTRDSPDIRRSVNYPERESFTQNDSTNSGMRSSYHGSDIVSVKKRLGKRSAESRERSPSPLFKRRIEESPLIRTTVTKPRLQVARAPIRPPISSGSPKSTMSKVISSTTVVNRRNLPSSSGVPSPLPKVGTGTVVREERFVSAEGKAMLRRTVLKRVTKRI